MDKIVECLKKLQGAGLEVETPLRALEKSLQEYTMENLSSCMKTLSETIEASGFIAEYGIDSDDPTSVCISIHVGSEKMELYVDLVPTIKYGERTLLDEGLRLVEQAQDD